MLLPWLSLTFCISLARSVAINDYFDIQAGNEAVGGCDEVYNNGMTGRQWILQWWDEAQTLTQIGRDAGNIFKSSAATRSNYLRFYGIGSRPNRARMNNDLDIATNWRMTSDFFNNPPLAKGTIFCSSAWLQQESWTDVAKATTGQPNPGGDTIRRVYPNKVRRGYWPFWAPAVNEYYFGPTSQMVNYCDPGSGNFGGTLDHRDFPPGTISLCMRNIFAAPGVNTLGAVQPAAGQPLERYMTYGVTMFHELFHWVIGAQVTFDRYSSVQGTLVVATNWANGIKTWRPAYLPENLSVFAQAQYLSMQTWPGQNPPTYVWDGAGNAQVL